MSLVQTTTQKPSHQQSTFPFSLVSPELFLPPEEVEKLRDFEEACLELYFREKNDKKQSSNDERLKVVSQR